MIATRHEYRGFVFSIEYEALESAYVVEFADFQNIITNGDSLSEAFRNACEALDLHLESLQQLGKPLPKHSLANQPV